MSKGWFGIGVVALLAAACGSEPNDEAGPMTDNALTGTPNSEASAELARAYAQAPRTDFVEWPLCHPSVSDETVGEKRQCLALNDQVREDSLLFDRCSSTNKTRRAFRWAVADHNYPNPFVVETTFTEGATTITVVVIYHGSKRVLSGVLENGAVVWHKAPLTLRAMIPRIRC